MEGRRVAEISSSKIDTMVWTGIRTNITQQSLQDNSGSVPAAAFTSNITITGNRVIGGTITIKCHWTVTQDEALISVALRPLPAPTGVANYYYYQFSPALLGGAVRGVLTHERISYEKYKNNSNHVIMRLTDLRCEDDQHLSCHYTIANRKTVNTFHDESCFLMITSAPTPVVLTIEQNSLHLEKEHLFFYEMSTITAMCAADVGRPGYGRFEWRLYDNDGPIYITSGDPRIQPLERDTSIKRSSNCSQFVKQSLVLTPSSALKDFKLACFVHNRLTVNRTREFCTDTKADLCAVSPNIWTIPRPDVMSVLLGVAIGIVELIAGIVLIIMIQRLLARFRPPPPPPPPPPRVVQQEPSEETDEEASTEIEEESFTEEGESSIT